MNKELKKIVLIGPVYPYRGGIAHYTGAMCRALEKKYSVSMISYKLQYPRFMFKKEQKDYDNKVFEIKNSEFIINTANPFNWLRSAGYIKKLNPDLIIVQWWHPYFAPCYFVMLKLLRNIKKVFICHNVFPHERFPLDKMLTRLTMSCGNAYIVQSKLDEKDLKTVIKKPVYRRSVHPTYNVFKFQGFSKEDARKRLGLKQEDKVILFFGFIKEYKGLKHLLRAMPEIVKELKNIRLLIAGEFGSDKEAYMELIFGQSVEDYIKIYSGYIPDRDIEQYFAASDIVVLPYESATQSGIVQMAYGFEKPVIVTDVGGLPEVVRHNKTGYIVGNRNSKELAEAVIRFYEEDREEMFVNEVKKESFKYSWDRMTELIAELYKEL